MSLPSTTAFASSLTCWTSPSRASWRPPPRYGDPQAPGASRPRPRVGLGWGGLRRAGLGWGGARPGERVGPGAAGPGPGPGSGGGSSSGAPLWTAAGAGPACSALLRLGLRGPAAPLREHTCVGRPLPPSPAFRAWKSSGRGWRGLGRPEGSWESPLCLSLLTQFFSGVVPTPHGDRLEGAVIWDAGRRAVCEEGSF
jgi:hypothetical protein